MDHRAAPDHRGVVRDEKSHRHELHPMVFSGKKLFPFRRRRGLDSHHEGNVRPVNIGVHQADPGAGLSQSDRQVHADGRFADPPFSAADGDRIFDPRNIILLHLTLSGTDVGRVVDLDLSDIRDLLPEGLLTRWVISSFKGQAGVVSTTVKETLFPSIFTSLTMFSVTISLKSSGSMTCPSAFRTDSCVTFDIPLSLALRPPLFFSV